jgi:hypothetical protein
VSAFFLKNLIHRDNDANVLLMQLAQASITNGDVQLTIDHHIHSDFYIVKEV